MEKELIKRLMDTGNFSIINESNGKMIRDVGDGIELYEQAHHSFPDKKYKNLDRAINWFLK
jgi:hypothetical protein